MAGFGNQLLQDVVRDLNKDFTQLRNTVRTGVSMSIPMRTGGWKGYGGFGRIGRSTEEAEDVENAAADTDADVPDEAAMQTPDGFAKEEADSIPEEGCGVEDKVSGAVAGASVKSAGKNASGSSLTAKNGGIWKQAENNPVAELQQAMLWAEVLGEPVSAKRRKRRVERAYGNQSHARRG